jgi:chromate transporter
VLLRAGAGLDRARRLDAAMKLDTLGTLAAHFALISLFAIGGAMAVVPEMHRQAVEVSGWMTDRQFADLFAIGQAAPGPNIIVVTLIGYQAAGVPGALVATLAMSRADLRHHLLRQPRLRPLQGRALAHRGTGRLVPVSVGLFAAAPS